MNKYWKDVTEVDGVVFSNHCYRTIQGQSIYWMGGEEKQAYSYLDRLASKTNSKSPDISPDISPDEALKICRIEDNKLFMPNVELNNFKDLKTIIVSLGGKWSTKEQCFIFKDDNPKSRIDNYLQTGKKTNTKKEQQAFFTPDEVADQAVELAQVEDRMAILEPCAGEGSLVRAIRRKHGRNVYISCFEVHELYANKLPEADPNFWEVRDFLKEEVPDSKFDRVIMNPPFGKGLAKSFVQKAFEWLKPQGVLVAILPLGKGVELLEGAGFVSNAFAGGIEVEELPAKAFASSGTNINTEIVIGRKPE